MDTSKYAWVPHGCTSFSTHDRISCTALVVAFLFPRVLLPCAFRAVRRASTTPSPCGDPSFWEPSPGAGDSSFPSTRVCRRERLCGVGAMVLSCKYHAYYFMYLLAPCFTPAHMSYIEPPPYRYVDYMCALLVSYRVSYCCVSEESLTAVVTCGAVGKA